MPFVRLDPAEDVKHNDVAEDEVDDDDEEELTSPPPEPRITRERYSRIPTRKVRYWCQIMPARFQACQDRGTIKRAHAAFFWTYNDAGRVYDVLVMDGQHGPDSYGTISIAHRRADFAHRGACCDPDWWQQDEDTPEALFGRMVEDGFEDVWQLGNALDQFEQVEYCSWATSMLKGIDHP